MRLLELKPLSDIYAREEDFTTDLAENLSVLGLGDFENVETEVYVGPRKADIIASGEDGVLVVENQFCEANWDHWGRLECYGRLSDATVAALVAEKFEELMIETCRLRNQVDDMTEWYLFQVIADTCDKLHFIPKCTPRSTSPIGLQHDAHTEKYAEFWEPIRLDRDSPFTGPPWYRPGLNKSINGVKLTLKVLTSKSYIRLRFSLDRREEVMELFPESEYNPEDRDTEINAIVHFLVLDKGINDDSAWPEIREKLINMGTDIYNKLSSL